MKSSCLGNVPVGGYRFGKPEVFDDGCCRVLGLAGWTERRKDSLLPTTGAGGQGGNENEIHSRPECRNKLPNGEIRQSKLPPENKRPNHNGMMVFLPSE